MGIEMSVWIVESISENDGGWLPNSRDIMGVFSSEELAEQWVNKHQNKYDVYDISREEVDEV